MAYVEPGSLYDLPVLTLAHRPAGVRSLLPATLAYTALTVLYTYPAAAQLGTHVFCGPWDGPMFLWNAWWGPHALFRLGTNPLFTRYLFYPDGASLVINTHCLLPALVSAPLQVLFGLVPAFNLMVLLTFVLSGLGAYLLTYDITADRRAAFAGGVIFAFGHIRVSQIVFFNLIQTELLVLFAWALWRSIQRASWRWSVVAGLFGACLLYTDYNLLFLSGYFAVACAAAAIVAALRRGASIRPLLGRLALAAAVILVLGLPLLVMMTQEIRAEGNYATKLAAPPYDESVPLERFLLRGPLMGHAHGTDYGIGEASYLGVIVMILAAFAVVTGRRSNAVLFWAGVALVFLLIALGPRLNLSGRSLERNLAGEPFSIPLPFAILRVIPILREVRTAHRYALVGWMAMAVLGGLGLKALLVRIEAIWPERRWLPSAACLIAAGLIFFDFAQIPFPKLYRLPQVPAGFHAIASDPRDVCVLEYPAGRKGYPTFSYFETIHGKPVYLEGQLARTSPQLRKKREASILLTLLDRIYDGETLSVEELDTLAPAIRSEARENAIGWIVLAWTDVERMSGKRDPVSPRSMEAADALVRRVLSVDEALGSAGPEDISRFYDHPPAERRSLECIYRMYKITPRTPAT